MTSATCLGPPCRWWGCTVNNGLLVSLEQGLLVALKQFPYVVQYNQVTGIREMRRPTFSAFQLTAVSIGPIPKQEWPPACKERPNSACTYIINFAFGAHLARIDCHSITPSSSPYFWTWPCSHWVTSIIPFFRVGYASNCAHSQSGKKFCNYYWYPCSPYWLDSILLF